MKILIPIAFLLIGMIGYVQAEQPQEKKMLETIKSCLNNPVAENWVICFKINSQPNTVIISDLICAFEKNKNTYNEARLILIMLATVH